MPESASHSIAFSNVHMKHLILVQAVLKGGIKTGNVVDLRMPGEVYFDSENNIIHRTVTDARPLREGASFFIFMKRSNGRGEEDVYMPALGIQSIFEIDADTNTVIPCDTLKNDPVVHKYLYTPLEAFWEEILFTVLSEIRRQ